MKINAFLISIFREYHTTFHSCGYLAVRHVIIKTPRHHPNTIVIPKKQNGISKTLPRPLILHNPSLNLNHILFLLYFQFHLILNYFFPIFISLLPLQLPILPPSLLHLTSFLLPRRLSLNRNPTLIPLVKSLNPIRQ